jgi:hypothetical protein
MSTLKVDNLQTTAGVGLYVLRAYINYTPLTTIPTIRSNGGFATPSTIIDNATGDQTLNFATALDDINYTYSGSVGYNNAAQSAWLGGADLTLITNWKTTTFLRINTYTANSILSNIEPADVCVLLMR